MVGMEDFVGEEVFIAPSDAVVIELNRLQNQLKDLESSLFLIPEHLEGKITHFQGLILIGNKTEQVSNFDAKAFFKLLVEGSEPLWPGCTKQTTLSAVATLLNIKADHNMSHECFESLLKAIKSTLPDDHSFRRNRENFRKGKVENDMPAPRLSGTKMLDRVMRLPVIQFGKIVASEITNGFGDSHNWVRRSIFGNCLIGLQI
ncbi:hypothetical protein MRB53_026658 [Persea americana]|uniref:Uncharacterized protein n=1 Tax=Persea americana TaxID=3435 RepID=A0ACC2LIU2_PERAE|nr:hypothetical protein MRB53_026658 [Persea americana]